MALSIKGPGSRPAGPELAKRTGESDPGDHRGATGAPAPRHRLRPQRSLADELDAIAIECAALPELDARSADEIIGYDENGLPA